MLPVPDCGWRRLKILFCLVLSRIFLFNFSFFIPSQSRQKISQHCGAEKKRFYTVCAITCIPHLTSLVGRVVCTRRPAVCIQEFLLFFLHLPANVWNLKGRKEKMVQKVLLSLLYFYFWPATSCECVSLPRKISKSAQNLIFFFFFFLNTC